MIKADIVVEVAKTANLPKLKAQDAVDTVFDAIRDALSEGQRVEFRGFGVFRVKERKRGVGRNLKTGEAVQIPPGKTIKFKPSSHFFD
ncbi:MAG: integration host factor subunit beta [Acidobacteria bacterium 37-65-4]|jgi:DNA-binding protein HU-beta|nr:MAG: integration host factor subunit beta [Acidobacteria bacterium 37-65-4]